MRRETHKYLACIGLLIGLAAGSGGAVETVEELRTVQEKIQNESDRLTRLSVKLDLLEEDLKLRRPKVEKLKVELRDLEEQMRSILVKIEGYQSGLEQFKKLSLEFQQIEAALRKLREQESSWTVIPVETEE